MSEVYIHLGSALNGTVGYAGPYAFVQLTYLAIRVEEDGADTSREVGWFKDGLWEMEDLSQWTDVTISTDVPSEVTPRCDICSKPEDQDPTNGREYNWNGETGCHLSCEETLVGILKTGLDYSDAVAMVREGER